MTARSPRSQAPGTTRSRALTGEIEAPSAGLSSRCPPVEHRGFPAGFGAGGLGVLAVEFCPRHGQPCDSAGLGGELSSNDSCARGTSRPSPEMTP